MKNLLHISTPIKLNKILKLKLIYRYSDLNQNNKIYYYKFLCKCEVNEEFLNFADFLEHIKNKHNIKDMNLNKLNKIIPKYNQKNFGIKFYWGLACKNCGRNFTCSLCNADLIIKNNKITLLKIYNLQCNKCKKIANFKYEKLLYKYLEERVLRKLIFLQYKDNFKKYDQNKDYKEELKGHIPNLCEKCRLSKSGYCWED